MQNIIKNELKYAVLLGITFALAACGGGGGAQNAEVPNTSIPAANTSNTSTASGSTTTLAKTFTLYNQQGTEFQANGVDSLSCARDNVTGLIWEVKTDEAAGATPTFRDKDFGYDWFNGSAGTVGSRAVTSGAAVTNANGRCQAATGLINCDTQNYINAVNAAGLCGYQDWRLPTTNELLGLFDTSRTSPPYIYAALGATAFDPEVQGQAVRGYWSSDTASIGRQAVSYSLKTGNRAQGHGSSYNYVRLVRGTAR